MSCNLRQSKIKRFAILPQTDCSTYNSNVTSAGIALPVIEFTANLDRGTGLISRADLMDGYGHEVDGVMGSNGWSLSATSELFLLPDNATVDYPSWAIMLLACGMAGTLDSGADTITLAPSVKPPATTTLVGSSDPVALSGVMWAQGDGSNDFRHLFKSISGTWSMNLPTGERATIQYDLKGLIQEDSSAIARLSGNMNSSNSFQSAGGAAALVVKGITASIPDSSGTTPVALQNLTLTYNASIPDVPNPLDSHGLGYGKPILAEAPTVEFSIGVQPSQNDVYFWTQYMSGTPVAITITLTSGVAGRDLVISLPRVQYTQPSLGEADGYDQYTIGGRCVRALGSSSAVLSLTWIAPSEV